MLVENVVLTAFKLDYLLNTFKVVKAYSAFRCLFKENVAKGEILDISDDFPIHLPALRDYWHGVPIELAVRLHSSDADHERKNWEDDYEDGDAHHGAQDQQHYANWMDEHALRFAVRRLEAMLIVQLLVEADTTELYYNEANIHGQLKEYQSNTFRDEFIRSRAQINGERTEHRETSNDECQLCECVAHPCLLVPRIQRLHLDESYVQV